MQPTIIGVTAALWGLVVMCEMIGSIAHRVLAATRARRYTDEYHIAVWTIQVAVPIGAVLWSIELVAGHPGIISGLTALIWTLATTCQVVGIIAERVLAATRIPARTEGYNDVVLIFHVVVFVGAAIWSSIVVLRVLPPSARCGRRILDDAPSTGRPTLLAVRARVAQ